MDLRQARPLARDPVVRGGAASSSLLVIFPRRFVRCSTSCPIRGSAGRASQPDVRGYPCSKDLNPDRRFTSVERTRPMANHHAPTSSPENT